MKHRVAAYGCAYRVNQQRHRPGQALLAPGIRDGGDDVRRGQHGGLGGLHTHVGGHRLDLSRDHVQRDFVKTLDTDRVLHRHGGDGDQCVHAEQRERA